MSVPALPQRRLFPASWCPSELAVRYKQDPTGKAQCKRQLGQAWLHRAGRRVCAYLLVGLKMKKELASGMGTAFSFSCSSARGRGRGLRGISGSSSSSSPVEKRKKLPREGGKVTLWTILCQKDLSTQRLVEGHHILCSSCSQGSGTIPLQCLPCQGQVLPGKSAEG